MASSYLVENRQFTYVEHGFTAYGVTVHSDFCWRRVRPHVIALIDRNMTGRSVTNDAENVIKYLRLFADLSSTDVVVYMDSEGRWDQLKHDGVVFKGFNVYGFFSLGAMLKAVGAL